MLSLHSCLCARQQNLPSGEKSMFPMFFGFLMHTAVPSVRDQQVTCKLKSAKVSTVRLLGAQRAPTKPANPSLMRHVHSGLSIDHTWTIARCKITVMMYFESSDHLMSLMVSRQVYTCLICMLSGSLITKRCCTATARCSLSFEYWHKPEECL